MLLSYPELRVSKFKQTRVFSKCEAGPHDRKSAEAWTAGLTCMNSLFDLVLKKLFLLIPLACWILKQTSP
jgi:hypothetical protein